MKYGVEAGEFEAMNCAQAAPKEIKSDRFEVADGFPIFLKRKFLLGLEKVQHQIIPEDSGMDYLLQIKLIQELSMCYWKKQCREPV